MPASRRRKRRLMDDQIRAMRERGERLRQAAQRVGITHAARAASVPYTTLRDYMGGNEMKFSAVAALARVCGVSLDWLAYGVGEATTDGLNPEGVPTRGGTHVVIPWLDDRDEGLRIGRPWLETAVGRDAATLRLVAVTGDAMVPTLREGDLAIIDVSSRQVIGGSIYGLTIEGGVLLRRLEQRIGGGVRVLSDNGHYPPQDLTDKAAAALEIVGQLVWAGGVPRG